MKRLRAEIMHPSGVRLTLRKRDCQNSLALVELFGCVWVAGWKHRDFPVLYNAFHVGDQILTVAGKYTIYSLPKLIHPNNVICDQVKLAKIIFRRPNCWCNVTYK